MRNVYLFVTSFLFALLTTQAYGNDLKHILRQANLTASTVPRGYSWFDANRSEYHYCVSKKSSGIQVEETKGQCKSKVHQIRLGQYLFTGTNQGEWIGSLTVTLPDGKTKSLLSRNIHGIIKYKNSLLIFAGLSHLNYDEGAIYRIDGKSDDPVLERITLLPNAPAQVIKAKNRDGDIDFLIITSNGLMTYDPQREAIKVIAIHQFWDGLTPNSAAQLGNKLLVGMKSGVAVLELDGNVFWDRIEGISYYSRSK